MSRENRGSPRVSVVIPVYNRAHYVRTAIDSILAQTFTDFELLVIDDGSSDNTCDVVHSYADPRVQLIRNEENLGIPVTRNRGLALARGEYMAILDSDDYAYPKRLAKQVAFLDAHPDHVVVGAWAAWMDSDGQPLKKVKRRPVNAEDAAATLIFRSCLQQSAVMGRTEVLRRYGYREDFDMSSDFELWVRLAEHHKIANLAEPLVSYRVHGGRTTRQKATRVVERQRAIFRYQLDELGLSYDEKDLERHLQLPRMSKHGVEPDAHYVDWAEDWLLRLIESNGSRQYFPGKAFARVLGWQWCQLYAQALRGRGSPSLRRFWLSPLKSAALSGLIRQGALYLSP